MVGESPAPYVHLEGANRRLGTKEDSAMTYTTTEATNVATVRRMFDEVINLGKIDVIDELFDPAFVTRTPQEMDRDGFTALTQAWRAAFDDLHCHVDDLLADGDRVAWSVRATGVHTGIFNGIPPKGRSVDFNSLNIATFRNGRAVEHIVVMDVMTMLTQLGVLGPPA